MIIVGTGQNAHVVDVAPESWFIVHADNGYDQLQFEIPWGNDAVPM